MVTYLKSFCSVSNFRATPTNTKNINLNTILCFLIKWVVHLLPAQHRKFHPATTLHKAETQHPPLVVNGCISLQQCFHSLQQALQHCFYYVMVTSSTISRDLSAWHTLIITRSSSQNLFVSKGKNDGNSISKECLPKKKSMWREIVPTSLYPSPPSKVGNKIERIFLVSDPLPLLREICWIFLDVL